MTIGLYGIQGVYNFGCEAIVRGAYCFIREVFPQSRVIYYSYSPEYDSNRLSDIDITVVPVKKNNSILKRAVNKTLRLLHVNRQILMFDHKEIIDRSDILLSIGGDIYTIPRILRENDRYLYYNPLVNLCDKAIRKGKKVIVYGASVGPWGGYKPAVEYYTHALKKYTAILCREEETVKYLEGLGFSNVSFFPDPAFQVRGSNDAAERKFIGVNFSPLSFNEVFGDHSMKRVDMVASLLDEVYDRFGYEIMMLPHVLSRSDDDNDLSFLEKIKSRMRNREHVSFGNYKEGFIGIKGSIRKCKVVIAARMHCAINSVDENTPTIFISYSQKSIGMCEYIYGNREMLVDLTKIDQELIPVLEKVINDRVEICMKLERRNIEIENYYNDNIQTLKSIFQQHNTGGSLG